MKVVITNKSKTLKDGLEKGAYVKALKGGL